MPNFVPSGRQFVQLGLIALATIAIVNNFPQLSKIVRGN